MTAALGLLRYWREILGGILLTALCLVWLSKEAAERRVEKYQSALAECEAMRAVQNAHVERLQADGDKLRAQVQAARSEGQREMDRAKDESDKLRNVEPAGCATPPLVMGADI